MEKLELKHLAPYLPYGLNGIHGDKRIDFNSANIWVFTLNAKPIFRPLSDLTKEIEHNGEKFVPMEVIGKLIDNRCCHLYTDDTDENLFDVYGWDQRTSCSCPFPDCDCGKYDRTFILKYDSENIYFYSDTYFDGDPDCEAGTEIYSSYNYIQKLFEWHFNVFNLPEHLWVDINTL